MKKLLLILLVLVVAIGLGQWLLTDPGYVLVSRGQWRLEGSLGFVLFALLLLLATVVVLVLVALWLWRRFAPARFSSHMRNRRGHKNLQRGIRHLGLGNWSKAEKQLDKASVGDGAYIGLLAAGLAAYQQEKFVECEAYCRQAAELGGDGELLAWYLALNSRLVAGEDVSAEVEELVVHHPGSGLLRELACRVAMASGRTNDLEKHLLVLPHAEEARYVPLWRALLDQTAAKAEEHPDGNLLVKSVWKKLPKSLRKSAEFQQRHEQLIANG